MGLALKIKQEGLLRLRQSDRDHGPSTNGPHCGLQCTELSNWKHHQGKPEEAPMHGSTSTHHSQ